MNLLSRNSISVRYGTETISYQSLAPETIKNCESLKSFKQKIKKWKLIAHVGYVKYICNMLVSSNNHWISSLSLLSMLLGSLLTDI